MSPIGHYGARREARIGDNVPMPWGLWCAVVVAGGALRGAVVVRRAHHYTKLADVLAPLTGRNVKIGIYFGRQYALVPLEGVIGSVDGRTRWVTFRSLHSAHDGE